MSPCDKVKVAVHSQGAHTQMHVYVLTSYMFISHIDTHVTMFIQACTGLQLLILAHSYTCTHSCAYTHTHHTLLMHMTFPFSWDVDFQYGASRNKRSDYGRAYTQVYYVPHWCPPVLGQTVKLSPKACRGVRVERGFR